MTILAPITDLGIGSAEATVVTSWSSALHGGAANCVVTILGTMRVLSGGVSYVDLDIADAETTVTSDGTTHTAFHVGASAETTVTARKGDGVKATFKLMQAKLANKTYAEISASFAPMTSHLYNGLPAPEYAVIAASFFPMLTGVRGLTGEIGEVHTSFQPLKTKLANKPYAEIHQTMLPMRSRLNEGLGKNNVLWYEFLNVSSPLDVDDVQVGNMTEALQFSGWLTGFETAVATMQDFLQISTSFDGGVHHTASFVQSLGILSSLSRDDLYDIWALNQVNNASTAYTNYNFNSMTTWNGKAIASASDGIYLLDGVDDSGTPIDVTITLRTDDFDSIFKKTVHYVYLGMQTSGDVMLTVITDDGQKYIYKVLKSELLHNRRIALGRGLRSRYYQFIIKNSNGESIELDTIDVYAIETTRRI